MITKKKILSLFLAFSIVTSLFVGCSSDNSSSITSTNSQSDNSQTDTSNDESTPPKKEQTMREITTMELTREMGVGINLGNTFEAVTDTVWETPNRYAMSWGSPIIDQLMIQGYADEGFGVLRIPVAWSNMMSEDYTLGELYLQRVTEVVDWALDTGMYVILNIHWDGGWWSEFPNDKEECMIRYTRIWEQLTEAYKDYGDYLMFESLNEEGGWDSVWNRYSNTGDKKASFGLLNEINQKFVDIVRASGGNNAKRHLLIAGYNTDFEMTSDELFLMPNDPENRCAVSVHYYTPPTFAILDKDASWGKARTTWGDEADIEELNKYFDIVKTRFIDNGVPVIVGEYGVSTSNKTPETIRNYLVSVTDAAYKRDMCPVLWDITGVFYNRYTCKMMDQELLSEMMAVKDKY